MAVRFNSREAARKALIEERLFRGIDLYQRGRIRFPYRQAGDGLRVGRTLFGVLSDSEPGAMYTVELTESGWVCTCPDFAKRGRWLGVCKHIAAVLAYKGELRCAECGRPSGRASVCEDCQAAAAEAQAQTDARYDFDDLLFG